MSRTLLSVASVSRLFGTRVAVDNVSFVLGAGDCLALFGPNGAGKTTLLRLLGGLLKPNGGSVRLSGSALGGETRLRARIGLISHRTMLYPALSALENVDFFAKLYGVPDSRLVAMDALRRMGVERLDVPVRLLSRGMLQRVSIARATVNNPELLLADEPYTGLDEAGTEALTSALRHLKNEGAGIVIVTHQLAQGLDLADYAAVMRSGKFVRYESSANMDSVTYAGEYRKVVGTNA